MSTFLTNRKMDPALAARIDASVRGDKSHGASAAFVRALLRFGIVIAIVALFVWATWKGREGGHILDRERVSLLDALEKTSASLGDDRAALVRDEGLIARFAGTYEGDFVATELRSPDALRPMLERPLVYIRGPSEELRSNKGIEKAATTSFKDAFLLCLLDPPRSRNESALLVKVRTAYTNPAMVEQRTHNAYRLADGYRGLAMLDPSWEARARGARDLHEVTTLRMELERTPIDQAKRALRAQMLVIVVDEPGDAAQSAELDGERSHDVRVEIVDAPAQAVLMRQRRHVDPATWSSATRTEYASGLDACGVAFDVRTNE